MRYPSISPDGKTIAFNYKGDIYLVASKGGEAKAITTHQDHDYGAVWSKDGKSIAFASNRYGNYDVFVMPSKGGAAKRLTYHSANDIPHSFKADGSVLFASSRLDANTNSQFPTGVLPELYSVNENGLLKQVLTTPAEDASWNSDNSKMIYHDKKGYENIWRKHHTSAITRDVWMYDPATKEHKQLTDFNGEDRSPVWSKDEKSFYYLSEESGSFNIWKKDISGASKMQLTKLDKHPVRFLSSSNDGVLAFGYDGELYTILEGNEPQKVSVQINADNDFVETQLIDVTSEVSDVVYSPNGKEIAFVARGEIFVSSLDYAKSRRITNTPEEERNISFSPDGRSILFAGERNESWNIYQVSLTRDEETNFYNSSVLKEEILVNTSSETFQPSYSPDGKEIAFLEERVILRVMNLASKKTRTVLEKKYNYSYSDGDQSYEWSPDSKWFLVNYLPFNRWNQDVGLISSDGNQLINLTETGYECSNAKWMMGGEAIVWSSGRDGMRSHGSWGSQSDCYAMFLTQEAYDKFNLSDAEFSTLKELKKKDGAKKTNDDKNESENDDEKEAVKPLVFDLEKAKDRIERLTINSSSLSDVILTKDGSKLYYLSAVEKGYDLWVRDFKKDQTSLLSKLGAGNGGLKFDKGEEHVIVLSNKKIVKISVADGGSKPVTYSAKMNWNQQAEFEFIYNHAWRQTLKKFYVEDMHGVDWAFYKAEYAKFLPHINNGYDFAEMLSELLGELNASHTGSGYRKSKPEGDHTAAFGFYPDYTFSGQGVRITEVMDKSPFLIKDSKVANGCVIKQINGTDVLNLSNYFKLMNNLKGENVLVTFTADNGKDEQQVFKPISLNQENDLAYERYVKKRAEEVDKLSEGKLGYVHVRGMNSESFRKVYSDALGKYADKDALIVDTRFNGGGWLHDDLATFLSGELYATFLPRGQTIGHEPLAKWYKPSAVIIGEGNYSDAHGFPFAYRALKIGKTVGMPVPGTMTAVWWETQINRSIYFGIPQVGMQGTDGKLRENFQFEPDIKTTNDYKSVAEGKDNQLEETVKLLLK
ncbi:MAG: Tol biopolymer transport system component/C-terminal processing protease CtpA/Prc [Salibacteraceae bacterium]|jgi:Tol biopolymer transport system component/C-terminal processing protease CtpA/Prc